LVPELGRVDIDALKLHVYHDPELRTKRSGELGQKTKPRVGLFVSNKAAQRRWSWQKWCQLAASLSEHTEVLIFRDPTEGQAETQSTGFAARYLCPPTIPDLIAAMSLLDIVVSADSAPVHLSSALQLPVVALFEDRPEKFLRWHPLGVRHIRLSAGCRVEDITVESVTEAVRVLLNAPMSAREKTS
jgi:ADP-heptose:LPS heptosyltransferase